MVEYLEDSEEFDVAFEVAAARLRSAVQEACVEQGEWPAKVAAAIRVALALAAREPETMRTIVVEPFRWGTAGALLYRGLTEGLSRKLAAGRERPSFDLELPAITEEALIGAVAASIADAVQRGREAALPGLSTQLIEFVLMPYLGVEAARQVARTKGM